jgi:tetratricopeptide (TPR) repeat protein
MRSSLVAFVLLLASCSRTPRSPYNQSAAWTRNVKPSKTAVAIALDRQVTNAIDAGEGDPFVRYLRQKVAADPDNSAARYELAAQYEKQGAPELAIEHYRIALQRQPDSEFAVGKLSSALAANDQQMESIALLVRFCESRPQVSAELLEAVALAQDEAGALGEGEMYHRRAIAANTSDDTLRNNLGFNFLRQKKYEDAAHEFKAALQLNPKSETARNNLGFALAHIDAKEALLHWSSLSGPAAAHNNLAAVLIEDGKLQEARREIQLALDYDRHNPAAIQNLQMVSELDGKPASFALNSIQSEPRSWTRALAKFFRGGGKPNPAVAKTDMASKSAK